MWTGWGQSWPWWLLPQIAGKVIKFNFFLYLSCRNVFLIFLNFWHDLQKWCFDIHFEVFSSEIWMRCNSAQTPPPFRSVLLLLQTTRKTGEILPGFGPLSMTMPVRIPINSRSQAMKSVGEAGFQSGPSKWTSGAASLWVSSQNWQPLQHGDT